MGKYDIIENSSVGIFKAHSERGWGIIDSSGIEIVPCVYDEVILDVQNQDPLLWMAAVRSGIYWGLYNEHQMLVKCICETPFEQYHTYNIAAREGKFALVDDKGDDVLPYRFEYYAALTGETFAVKNNGLWGIVDDAGEELLPCQCDEMMIHLDSFLVPYRLDGKWGIYDTVNKKILFPPLWEYPTDNDEKI